MPTHFVSVNPVLLFPIGIFGRKSSTLRSNCINGYRFYGLLKNPSPLLVLS